MPPSRKTSCYLNLPLFTVLSGVHHHQQHLQLLAVVVVAVPVVEVAVAMVDWLSDTTFATIQSPIAVNGHQTLSLWDNSNTSCPRRVFSGELLAPEFSTIQSPLQWFVYSHV